MALDRNKVVESFIGTVAGAAVALASFWVQSEYKERQNVQSWFEEQYIAQAIDPVGTFVSILKLHLLAPEIPYSIKDNIPLTPLTRIETLTGTSAFSDALAHAVLLTSIWPDLEPEEKEPLMQAIDGIRKALAELRLWALEQRIESKSEIYRARLDQRIIKLVVDIESVAQVLRPG